MGVRVLTVQFGPDDRALMEQADGSRRIANMATVDRVWLDERSDAFRWERGVQPDAPAALVSVFDGSRAAIGYGNGAGPKLIRYEGAPGVVARLAGWISVDAARAYTTGAAVPAGVRVREREAEPSAGLFELPGGVQARLWRQLDPIASAGIGDVCWLGAEWGGHRPDFAASLVHFEREHRRAAVVVYPGVCVTTSERRPGDRVVARAAVGRTRRDGSFGVRPPKVETTLWFSGYELAPSLRRL